MTLSVDTIFLWVRDIDHALEWYSSIGLSPGQRYGAWQTMEVAGDTRFALHEGDRAAGASTAVPSFRVEDLDAELARLSALGIQPTDAAITDTGVARFTTFTDPDGNEIQLIERR